MHIGVWSGKSRGTNNGKHQSSLVKGGKNLFTAREGLPRGLSGNIAGPTMEATPSLARREQPIGSVGGLENPPEGENKLKRYSIKIRG